MGNYFADFSSASGGFTPIPLPELRPWTPLGDFRPPDPVVCPPPNPCCLATPLALSRVLDGAPSEIELDADLTLKSRQHKLASFMRSGKSSNPTTQCTHFVKFYTLHSHVTPGCTGEITNMYILVLRSLINYKSLSFLYIYFFNISQQHITDVHMLVTIV